MDVATFLNMYSKYSSSAFDWEQNYSVMTERPRIMIYLIPVHFRSHRS
jgi:hypothetical protein